MILGMVCAVVALCFLYCKMENPEGTVLRCAVEANTFFVLQFICASLPFLLCDRFPVDIILIILLVLNIVKVFIRYKRNTHFKWSSQKSELLMIVLLCLSIPFIKTTAEDVSAISDQGAYFTHVVTLVFDNSQEVHKIQELGAISDKVDQGIRDLQDQLLIHYHEQGEDNFYLHALKTWCVIPALFGRMFGIWHAMFGLGYLYALLVLLFFYICQELCHNKYTRMMSVIMFSLSPLVLYISKAGLSEIVMLFLGVASLYFMLKKDRKSCIVAGLCLGLWGYVHISTLIYLPIFYVALMLEGSRENNKNLCYTNLIQITLYSLSIWFVYMISPIYVMRQFAPYTLGGSIPFKVLLGIITASCLAGAIVQLLVMRRYRPVIEKIRIPIYNNFKIICLCAFAIIILMSIYHGYMLAFTDCYAIPEGMDAGSWNLRSRYVNSGITAISYLNIVNIMRATSVVGLVLFFLLPFLRKEFSGLNKILYFMGIYGLFFFTCCKVDTPFNYYASRYFLPYTVPIIILAVGSTVKSKSWAIYAIMIIILCDQYFWPAFLTGAPQRGQYKLVQDACEHIPENAVVLCNEESGLLNTRLTSNLRLINDNLVYNLKNIDEIVKRYGNQNIYILSETELDGYDKIWGDVYDIQYSFGNGPNGSYAMENGTYEISMNIYEFK